MPIGSAGRVMVEARTKNSVWRIPGFAPKIELVAIG